MMWLYVVLAAILGVLLYRFGKRDEKGLFVATAFFLLVPPGVYYLTVLLGALQSVLGLIAVFAIVAYFSLWMWTLFEQAGEGEAAWFLLTFIVSPLWIVYRVVK